MVRVAGVRPTHKVRDTWLSQTWRQMLVRGILLNLRKNIAAFARGRVRWGTSAGAAVLGRRAVGQRAGRPAGYGATWWWPATSTRPPTPTAWRSGAVDGPWRARACATGTHGKARPRPRPTDRLRLRALRRLPTRAHTRRPRLHPRLRRTCQGRVGKRPLRRCCRALSSRRLVLSGKGRARWGSCRVGCVLVGEFAEPVISPTAVAICGRRLARGASACRG
jgi:hypothetical protein